MYVAFPAPRLQTRSLFHPPHPRYGPRPANTSTHQSGNQPDAPIVVAGAAISFPRSATDKSSLRPAPKPVAIRTPPKDVGRRESSLSRDSYAPSPDPEFNRLPPSVADLRDSAYHCTTKPPKRADRVAARSTVPRPSDDSSDVLSPITVSIDRRPKSAMVGNRPGDHSSEDKENVGPNASHSFSESERSGYREKPNPYYRELLMATPQAWRTLDSPNASFQLLNIESFAPKITP